MSYKVVLIDRVRRMISSWGLPDAVLVEVCLRLRERLSVSPAQQLMRTTEPFDGLTYGFEMIDPNNRLSVYRLLFHVLYSQDEETLFVVHAAMFHTIGL